MSSNESFSGVFSVIILFISVQQILCNEGGDVGNSRKKRDYSSSPYGYSGYPGGNVNNPDECTVPICKPTPHCLSPNAIPNQDKPEKINNTWLATPRQFYLTAGSCWGYSSFAELFLNREVLSGKELTEMCFTLFFSNDGLAYNSAYGLQWVQNCSVHSNDLGQDCLNVPSKGSDELDLSLITVDTYYTILTDSKTFVLYYRCVDGRHGDYILTTTQPYIEMSTAKVVLDTIQEMRIFDPGEVRFLSCTAPSYPAPFQNYPNDKCAFSNSYSDPSPCSANSYLSTGNYNNNGGSQYSPQYNRGHGNSYRPSYGNNKHGHVH